MIDLDHAIDRVAAELTRVDHDPIFAQRIVAALPERHGWFGWRLAAAALLTAAAMTVIVLRPFDERSTVVLRTFGERSTFVPLHEPVAANFPRTILEPSLNVRRTIVERSSNARLNVPDHERSLDALAVSSLAIAGVAPEMLPDEGSLSLPSLQVGDLPLTAESFPQRN